MFTVPIPAKQTWSKWVNYSWLQGWHRSKWQCRKFEESLQWRPNERWRLKSPAPRLFTQPYIQTQMKEKNQSYASLAFVRGIHRWPMNSPHKGPVTPKMFPFDDVIMEDIYMTWVHYGLMSKQSKTQPNRVHVYGDVYCISDEIVKIKPHNKFHAHPDTQ